MYSRWTDQLSLLQASKQLLEKHSRAFTREFRATVKRELREL